MFAWIASWIFGAVFTLWLNSATSSSDSIHPGWDCLRNTTPSLSMRYPSDAQKHFIEIHKAMGRWAANFHMGVPGCENYWIYHSLGRLRWGHMNGHIGMKNDWKYTVRKIRPSFLFPRDHIRNHFGPFVPLLLTWTDIWVNGNRFRYPLNFIETLERVLRPDVPYVTVSQNDEGIGGKCELLMSRFPNILVFSSGGYGHIPVPLYHQQETAIGQHKPMPNRTFLVSYVGSGGGPDNFRTKVFKEVQRQFEVAPFGVKIGKLAGWRHVMYDSVATLVPRGFGRTAFHLVETLQHGLIPIYVYSDVPWVPYQNLFHTFGYITNLTHLGSVIEGLRRRAALNQWKVLERMEALSFEYSKSHFTPEAISEQIFRYLQDNPNDLECHQLPPTPRDDGSCPGEAELHQREPSTPKSLLVTAVNRIRPRHFPT